MPTRLLKPCGYPDWELAKEHSPPKQWSKDSSTQETEKIRMCQVVLLYLMRLSEDLRRCFLAHRVDVYFKHSNTLRQILCYPKVSAKNDEVCEAVYKITCGGREGESCGNTQRDRTSATQHTEDSPIWRKMVTRGMDLCSFSQSFEKLPKSILMVTIFLLIDTPWWILFLLWQKALKHTINRLICTIPTHGDQVPVHHSSIPTHICLEHRLQIRACMLLVSGFIM